MKQEPNFEKAIDAHNEAKANKITKFKQPSVAATILGISEKVLGRITGSVFISTEHSTDTSKRVNIGLQLKIRNVVRTFFFDFILAIFFLRFEIILFDRL